VHATVADAGALGAALLAGVAAGVYRDVDEAVRATRTSTDLERT